MESTALARLRRVSTKQTTRLIHYGRKTGKPHQVTIWFVLAATGFTSALRLSVVGDTVDGAARFLTDRAEHERAMAAIRRKYWIVPPIIEMMAKLLAKCAHECTERSNFLPYRRSHPHADQHGVGA